MIHNNKKLIVDYFEEIWNKGNLDMIDIIIDKEYINHNPGTPDPIKGPDGLKPIVSAIRIAFPDLHFEIKNIVDGDNQVSVHTIMTGTHCGDLYGIKPTQKSIKVNQMQIEKIKEGKIIEHWRITDEMALMNQLGVLSFT